MEKQFRIEQIDNSESYKLRYYEDDPDSNEVNEYWRIKSIHAERIPDGAEDDEAHIDIMKEIIIAEYSE
ncbi:MAG: hypothetical protein ACTSQZ_02000 [Candidatus Thorarchaeota archaeon]